MFSLFFFFFYSFWHGKGAIDRDIGLNLVFKLLHGIELKVVIRD